MVSPHFQILDCGVIRARTKHTEESNQSRKIETEQSRNKKKTRLRCRLRITIEFSFFRLSYYFDFPRLIAHYLRLILDTGFPWNIKLGIPQLA